jgi:hypothetical protein
MSLVNELEEAEKRIGFCVWGIQYKRREPERCFQRVPFEIEIKRKTVFIF